MQIGLALARDAVRAVAIWRDRIVWAAEAPLEPGAALPATIASLLQPAPVRRFPRPIVSAAVGPHASQVRLVAGLPDVQDPMTLAAIIRQNVGAFFLKNGVPLLTTGTLPVRPGVALAGAIEEPCVAAVRELCSARRWRLRFIAPTPVALGGAFQDPSFTWTDGAVVVEVTQADGTIGSVRTRPVCAAEPAAIAPRLVSPLTVLGDGALRYADAYGAAVLAARPALTLDALGSGAWTRSEVLRRCLLPTSILTVAIVSLALSPLAAFRAAGRSDARLSRVRPAQWRAVESASRQLDRLTAILEDVRRFSASRSATTPVLGTLARALPEGSAVLSLELGDDHGQIVAMSPSPAPVLAAIQRLPGARSVELIGPLRREGVTAREVQRVTVRWRRVRP
jgi:hypothetical protein